MELVMSEKISRFELINRTVLNVRFSHVLYTIIVRTQ